MKWTSCEALEGCGVSVSVPCVGVGLRAIYCVDLTRVADTIDLSEDSHCGNYYLTPIPPLSDPNFPFSTTHAALAGI